MALLFSWRPLDLATLGGVTKKVYVCAVRHPELVSGSHEMLNMKRDAETSSA